MNRSRKVVCAALLLSFLCGTARADYAEQVKANLCEMTCAWRIPIFG